MRKSSRFILSAVLTPGVFLHAETPADRGPIVTTLPTVIVTASGPETSAPSVTNIPVSTPQTTVIREVSDLSGRAPNLRISSASLNSFGDIYAIRGIANTPFFSNPAVAFYVDDVPAGDAFSFFAPLYHVTDVDIFRGPQPTRFGLNGEAGAIVLHTRRATDEWHGEVSGRYGSYDTQEYQLWLGGPLVKDRLKLDISGFWGLGTGFIDNTFLGNRLDDRDTLAGRAVLTFTPSEDWEITAGVEGARVNDGAQRIVKLEGDPFQVRSDVPGSLNMHQHREWLNIAKRFDTWQVRSVTSHSQWEVDPAELDLDLTPAKANLSGIFPGILPFAPGALSEIRREQTVWSEEIRFESLPPEPAPDGKAVVDGKSIKAVAPIARENHFRWNAGLFFQRKDTDGDDVRSFSAPFVTAVPVFFAPGSFFLAPITAYTPLRQRTTFSQEEENWAAYLNAGYTWGRLDIDAGVRLDYTQKDFRRLKTDPISLPQPIGFSDSLQEWTGAPTVGLTYHVNDNVDVFARTAWSFKPGGFSAFTDTEALARYERETVWSTEAGIRAHAFDGRLRGQLTGYVQDIDNYQVERTFSFADYLVVNAGEAHSSGVELELSWEMLEGLTLSGAFGYNQTELHDYRDPFTGEDLGGNEAPFIPKYTATAALDYAHSCGFRAHVDFVAVGETDFTDTNVAHFRQAGYGVLNARIGYERDHYGVYLFARNLTDTQYYTFKNSDIDAGVIGEPRMFGVMALLKF